MLILAIESATPVAGIALQEDGRLLFEQYVDYRQTHSESLMPMVDNALRCCSRQAGDLDLVAASAGPGSFTGLRIGLAAAKGLAMGTGAAIMAVPTLKALALNAAVEGALICPLLDARKQEVYTGLWECREGRLLACMPEQARPVAGTGTWLAEALSSAHHHRVCCLGSGYASCRQELQASLGSALITAPPHLTHPRASAVAQIAAELWEEGQRDDLFRLEPVYIRKSEAEYQLEKRSGIKC